MNLGIKSPDCLAIGMAMAFAMEDAGKCFVSQEKLEQIVEMWDERHPHKEYHPHNCPPKDAFCYEEIKEEIEEIMERWEVVYGDVSRLHDKSEELQNLMEKYRIDDERSRVFVERTNCCVDELFHIVSKYFSRFYCDYDLLMNQIIDEPNKINKNYRKRT